MGGGGKKPGEKKKKGEDGDEEVSKLLKIRSTLLGSNPHPGRIRFKIS